MPVIFHFGVFEFDEAAGELRKNGTPIKLQPQPARLLKLLLENAGTVVKRDQIQQSVWDSDTVVDYELGVNRCIRQLRSVLFDDAASPRFIKTIPRTGYSFIAPVRSTPLQVPAVNVAQPTVPEVQLARPVRRQLSSVLKATVLSAALFASGVALWRVTHRHGLANDLQAIPLTSYVGSEFAPSFSPEARQVAFVWNGAGQDNFDIYINAIGSATSVRLTTDPATDYSPAWSPDGRWIAFCRGTDGPGGSVWIIPAIGGAERKLIDLNSAAVPEVRSLSWLPDSQSLVVSDTSASRNRGLWLINVNTGGGRRLTSPPEGEDDMYPAVSPGGETVAFTRETNQGLSAAYLIGLRRDGTVRGTPWQLGWRSFAGGGTRSFAWTQDGESLIVQSIQDGRLWVGPAQPRAVPRLLASLGEEASGPAVSSRGQLAFVRSSFIANIGKIAMGGIHSADRNEATSVIASTRVETSPAVSPDGKSLAFISDRTGFSEVWRVNIDGTNPVRITAFGRSTTGSPSWSPDGSRIAFDSRATGEALIYAVSANGGTPVQITTFPSVVPAWSPDGTWIYFSSKQSGAMEIWRIPCSGGPAEQVTHSGGFAWRFSGDKQRAYYLNDNDEHAALYQRTLATGDDRLIARSVFRRGFAPAKGGVYYVAGTAYGPVSLDFFDLSTGSTVKVQDIPAIDARGVTLSPDEKFLFFGQVEHRSSELRFVEQFWK